MISLFDRIWTIGWANPKPYYKPVWLFHFNYWKNSVWQIMILGFYITSWKSKSILAFCKRDCKYLSPTEEEQKKGEFHYCSKYKKYLLHLGAHPKLRAVEGCSIAILKGEK